MNGKSPDEDQLIADFQQEVIAPGHHLVSYDPKRETVIVLSAEAARHLRDVVNEHACDTCERINHQLEVQELRQETDESH